MVLFNGIEIPFPSQDFRASDAVFSDDRIYRYALWRWWDVDKDFALFIGLNPSTADETQDDPTIRRCKRFSADWGFGGYVMANIFAYRATDTKVMLSYPEPIGPDNDAWIDALAVHADIVVTAWGAHGQHMNRGHDVLQRLPEAYHLGLTQSGQPKHPLYLRADTKPIRWGK